MREAHLGLPPGDGGLGGAAETGLGWPCWETHNRQAFSESSRCCLNSRVTTAYASVYA